MAAAADPLHPKYPMLTHAHVNTGWKARQLPISEAAARMARNTEKAIREHREEAEQSEMEVFASLAEAKPKEMQGPPPPLSFTMNDFVAQGPRSQMEDAHFYRETPEGILTAVFDGHGGAEVSQFAAHYTHQHFHRILSEQKGNVHAAFEYLFDTCQDSIKKDHPKWTEVGTTALVCYIDKRTNLIYTATLGDTEATIYRNCGDTLKSIPLSCLRSWYTPKDNARLAKAWEVQPRGHQEAPQWMNCSTPSSKWLRTTGMLSASGFGLNVARALGDLASTVNTTVCGPTAKFLSEELIVIHKPKITLQRLEKGDILVLRCDGVTDFLSEKRMHDIFASTQIGVPLAKEIGITALSAMPPIGGGDNVTVITIEVKGRK